VGVLSRYFLARFLSAFAAVLVILGLAVAVVELIGDFDDVVTSSEGLGGALTYIVLRMGSFYLPLLVPVSAFVAAFVSLGTAARALEVVALKAGGISPLRPVVPLLVAAAFLSALALAANETLGVRAHVAWRRQVRGGEELSFRRGSFWYHKGRYVYNVGDADPGANLLRDVGVYELDARGRLVATITAARVAIAPDGRWQLEDAVMRRFDPDDPAAPARYLREPHAELVLHESQDELPLLDAEVQGLSIRDLREYRASRPPDEPAAQRAQALVHERLTTPLSTFVFVVLAIPFGLSVERTRSLARPALQGVGALFAFYTLRGYGATLASEGLLAPAATPWVILLVFGLLGVFILTRVPR
jgi:lipopolysaccharide export system permease protein